MRQKAPRIGAVFAAAVAFGLVLAGCTTTASSPAGTPTEKIAPEQSLSTKVYPLPVPSKVDYQLGGGYTPQRDVVIVARDSTEEPFDGSYGICYINGFQTQPQDKKLWLAKDRADLVLRDKAGKPVIDANWPDEMILDISTAAKRARLAVIQNKIINGCRQLDYAAVEFDNLDSYTRSRGAFTLKDALAFATLMVADAHGVGLAAGQKNTAEFGSLGKSQAKFDFAIAEECDHYKECDAYTKVYGKQVIDIEYSDALRRPFAKICADPKTPRMTIERDRNLTTPKNKHYVYKSC